MKYYTLLRRLIATVFRVFRLPAHARQQAAGIRFKRSQLDLITALWSHEIWEKEDVADPAFWRYGQPCDPKQQSGMTRQAVPAEGEFDDKAWESRMRESEDDEIDYGESEGASGQDKSSPRRSHQRDRSVSPGPRGCLSCSSNSSLLSALKRLQAVGWYSLSLSTSAGFLDACLTAPASCRRDLIHLASPGCFTSKDYCSFSIKNAGILSSLLCSTRAARRGYVSVQNPHIDVRAAFSH